jgi:hypothetical protein
MLNIKPSITHKNIMIGKRRMTFNTFIPSVCWMVLFSNLHKRHIVDFYSRLSLLSLLERGPFTLTGKWKKKQEQHILVKLLIYFSWANIFNLTARFHITCQTFQSKIVFLSIPISQPESLDHMSISYQKN